MSNELEKLLKNMKEQQEDFDILLDKLEKCFGISDTDDATNCATFEPITVFHRITQSPEVLAEKLVYSFYDYHGYEFWTSTLCNHTQWEMRAEAVAATVAKLKEVIQ